MILYMRVSNSWNASLMHIAQSIHTINIPALSTKFNVNEHDPHIGMVIVIWSANLIQYDGTLNLLKHRAMIAMTTRSNAHTYSLVPVAQIHSTFMVYIMIAIHCGDHVGCESMWPPHRVLSACSTGWRAARSFAELVRPHELFKKTATSGRISDHKFQCKFICKFPLVNFNV